MLQVISVEDIIVLEIVSHTAFCIRYLYNTKLRGTTYANRIVDEENTKTNQSTNFKIQTHIALGMYFKNTKVKEDNTTHTVDIEHRRASDTKE